MHPSIPRSRRNYHRRSQRRTPRSAGLTIPHPPGTQSRLPLYCTVINSRPDTGRLSPIVVAMVMQTLAAMSVARFVLAVSILIFQECIGRMATH